MYHGPLHVTIDVGEPVVVDGQRDRSAKQDPAMAQVGEQLQAMLDALAAERTPVAEKPPARPDPYPGGGDVDPEAETIEAEATA